MYLFPGAINYIGMSEPTRTQMFDKDGFDELCGAYPAQLRRLIRSRFERRSQKQCIASAAYCESARQYDRSMKEQISPPMKNLSLRYPRPPSSRGYQTDEIMNMPTDLPDQKRFLGDEVLVSACDREGIQWIQDRPPLSRPPLR